MACMPEETVALLERTPGALNALLRGLPERLILGDEGENTWNAREVVAHLIHTEQSNWIPRARMILEFGDRQTFAPLDREAFQADPHKVSEGALLDEFARLRAENLKQLRSLDLTPESLKRTGRHPAFGVVSLSQLLATWAAHDLTHLHQISRILAHQFRQAVGPWEVYLGVLKCEGHSARQ
jgi:DinB family protein